MTSHEITQLNKLTTTQAVMKEHQKTMQKDIDELKENSKEINDKLDILTAKLDSISGGKQALIWVTATIISISAIVIGFLNLHKN